MKFHNYALRLKNFQICSSVNKKKGISVMVQVCVYPGLCSRLLGRI